MQKSVAFLYANIELSEKEIITPFTIASTIIKYLRINLTKEVKKGHWKLMTLIKEAEDSNGKILLFHGLEELTLLYVNTTQSHLYSQCNLIKIPMTFCREIE